MCRSPAFTIAILIVAATPVVAWPVHAAPQAAAAAEAITAADVARHVHVIADDSMLGRDTPSPGLEKTAQYVADQFKDIGLQSGSGSWVQRYKVPLQLDFVRSRILFAIDGKEVTAGLSDAAYLSSDVVPKQPGGGRVVWVTGFCSPDVVSRIKDQLRGKIIVYVAPTVGDSILRVQSTDLLRSKMGASGFVLLSEASPDAFAGELRAHRYSVIQRPWNFDPLDSKASWSAHIQVDAVTGLRGVLVAAGVDVAQARADTSFNVRELPTMRVAFEPQLLHHDTTTAPNVVGILEGSDPKLKHQYIVFSAHMDHLGITSGGIDSINNGADDNASGVAGLIELAQAFSRLGVRPRRSLVFLAVSGAMKHRKSSLWSFWGSRAFSDPLGWNSPMPIAKLVSANGPDPWSILNINLDMIGRPTGDSVMIGGLDAAQFETPIDWVVNGHQELRLTVVDGGTIFTPRSDHFIFAERAPSLYVHNGDHDKPHAGDSPTTIDSDYTARVFRLVFYVGQEIANAPKPPRWSPAGRRQIFDHWGPKRTP